MVILLIIASLAVLLAAFFIIDYEKMFKPNLMRSEKPINVIPYDMKSAEPFISRIRDSIDWFYAQHAEKITITSFDGLKLAAWYLPAENAKGSVICMHGFHSCGLRDFSLAVKWYHEQGWNVLLPDQRSHGMSEGKYLTFGVRERFDCRQWIETVNGRNGTSLPVFLDGISMGCATVVMTSGFDLSANVKGIIADCGYTSPFEEMCYVMKQFMNLKPYPVMFFSRILARVIAGFGLKEYSTLTALRTNKIPVLFIHGDADDFVPPGMTMKNYEACTAEKELFTVKGAAHAVSYLVAMNEYQKRVTAFLERCSR